MGDQSEGGTYIVPRDGMKASMGTFSYLRTVAEEGHNGKMGMFSSPITYLGRTTFRNRGIPFGIKESDRLSHMYVIGRTGTGSGRICAGQRHGTP
jgi:hypothetical protein